MDSKLVSFDKQLFDWEDWASEGPMSMQFSNVTLKVAVGDYAVGTKFPFAFLLGEVSLLVLVDEKHEEHGFRLNLNAAEAVDPSELHAEGEACGCGHEHH